MTPLRLVGLVLAATLAGTGLASATSYAAPGDASPPNAQGGYEPSYVTGNVSVRSDPSSRARVVNRLRRGQFVNLGACRGAWCFVDAQGGNGWVSGRFIGRGDNPYQRPGPAAPGIPPQEPGTGHRAPAGRY